jgi:hypothetical protein
MGVGGTPFTRSIGGVREAPPGRCPACGDGDLFTAIVARRAGGVRPIAVTYCAGSYDRGRRRYLRPGCGYAGGPPAAEPKPVETAVPLPSPARVADS